MTSFDSRPARSYRLPVERRGLFVLLGASFLAAALMFGPPALAGTYANGAITRVSGPSPFSSCTADNVGAQPGKNYLNSEVEPSVAVNPGNMNNFVGAWQQDRWSNGGSRGIVAGVSTNGGASWGSVVVHGLTLCSGGTLERATDPWVSFSPNGTLYLSNMSLSASGGTTAIMVSRSTDGGASWSTPKTLVREAAWNDKPSVTADPGDSSYVYAVWYRLSGGHGPVMFSRTTDGGSTWSTPRAIFDPGAGNLTTGSQIVVLPGGTVVDLFDLTDNYATSPVRYVAVIRSIDKGVTWSKPILVNRLRAHQVIDPDNGKVIRTGNIIPEVAVDRNPGSPGYGHLYAAWEDSRFSSNVHDDIAMSLSADGGLSWTTPIKANKTPSTSPGFTPMVRVASNGTVGITYYDFRNNTSASGLPTDYWFVHCHPTTNCTNRSNWSETHVAGPFNVEMAPYASGYFLGDYQGLATVGSGFEPFFIQARTATNPSDAYFGSLSSA